MHFEIRSHTIVILVLFFLLLLASACSSTRITPVTQVVRVTRLVRATQVVEVTRVVPVTRIVQDTPREVTRVVLVAPITAVTQVMANPSAEVTRLVVVTQVVVQVVTQAIPTPSIVPTPTVGPTPPTPTTAVHNTFPEAAKLYFSAGDSLYRMNLNGTQVERVAAGLGLSERMALDPVRNRIYLDRWGVAGQILGFDLGGDGSVWVLSDGPAAGGQGIAVDVASGQLFIGLYSNGVYEMDLANPGTWTQLVDPSALNPVQGQRGQLQIDPDNGQIYFQTAYNANCDACRAIYRVDFDGSNLVQLVPANGGDGLALDLAARKMYYSNAPGNLAIMRANLDGSGLEKVQTIPAPFTFCRSITLDVAAKKMYLSLYDETIGYHGRALARANMDGTGFEILYEMYGDTAESVFGGMVLYLP